MELVGSASVLLAKMLSKKSDLVKSDIVKVSECSGPAQHGLMARFTDGQRWEGVLTYQSKSIIASSRRCIDAIVSRSQPPCLNCWTW